MKFTGVFFAVLCANFFTLVLITGAYFYLNSNHGQMLLDEMGLHSFFVSAIAFNSEIFGSEKPSEGFQQPSISDMKLMIVPPLPAMTQRPAAGEPPDNLNSDRERRNHSAIKSSLEMCRFWNAEYQKDGAPQSKTYRDAACRRYEQFSGMDSDEVVDIVTSPAAARQRAYLQQQTSLEKERKERQLAIKKRAHKQYCQSLSDRIDHYDDLLRAGGKARYMNELQQGRRELSMEYSRKCLLGK
ncbi:MAG: hypothetical protein ACX936_13415 [Marinobacter sp.]